MGADCCGMRLLPRMPGRVTPTPCHRVPGRDRVGWGVLQARKGLGGMQEWIGASSKPVRGWEGREMDLG